ncbi:MAG: hypothetical protein ACR2HH_02945 [Chthoniobacterales bacterium]
MIASTPAEFSTIFDWAAPRSRRLSLLSFLGASIGLHALCFYIFQIIYPPAAPPLPPPARVSIITPESEEGRVLLRWVEAEDPALSSITQRPPREENFAPPKAQYVASFVNRQPPLKEVPPYEPDLRVPSSQPPAPVPMLTPKPTTLPALTPTKIAFSENPALGAPRLPPLHFAASGKQVPQAAQFRVAINSLGEVRYCFLQDSSGDAALDEQAHHFLELARFPAIKILTAKSANEMLWALAAVEWGNDLAAPSPAPLPTPAP